MFEEVDGGLRLGIDDHSREVVVHLLRELRDEVATTKDAPHVDLPAHMKRLFPAAYHADERRNEEYRRLTHTDLGDSHIAAIDDAIDLLSPGRVFRPAELERLVRALNAMRLVLGTLLDVSEGDAEDASSDDADSDAPDDERDNASNHESDSEGDDTVAMQREVYDYLGWLLHTCLDRLRA
jgi:hypothetical protein